MEALECPICYDRVGAFLLHCGHGMCSECIHRLSHDNSPFRGEFKCPLCRTFIHETPVLIHALSEFVEEVGYKTERIRALWNEEQEQEQGEEEEEWDGGEAVSKMDFCAPYENSFGYQPLSYYMTTRSEINNRTLQLLESIPFRDASGGIHEGIRFCPYRHQSILLHLDNIRGVNHNRYEYTVISSHRKMQLQYNAHRQIEAIKMMEDQVHMQFPELILDSVLTPDSIRCYGHRSNAAIMFLPNASTNLILACRGVWHSDTHAGIRLHLMAPI